MAEESTTPDLAVLIRRIVDAASTRDLDAAMSCYAADGVYDMSAVGLGTREGYAAIREHFEEWWGGYEEYEHELEEMRVVSEGVAFCVLVQRGRVPGGTGWVQFRYPAVVTSRHGLIERITAYGDIDTHRAAAETLAEERASMMAEDSVTPDLVELAAQAFEAGSRHDLDAVMCLFAADAVLDMSTGGLGIYRGAAAIREFVESWWATFDDHTIEQEETVDLGLGVLFSKVREVGRLAASDGRVEQQRGWVTVWVGGKVVHYAVYDDPDEARAAAERLAEERG